MLNVMLTAGILVCTVILALFVMLTLQMRRFEKTIKRFVSAPDEKTPSPLCQLTRLISTDLVDIAAGKLTASGMGNKSAAVRQAKAIEADILEDTAPGWVQALLSQMPQLRKTLRTNPQLAGMALQKLRETALAKQGQGSFPMSGGAPAPPPIVNQGGDGHYKVVQ